MTHVRMIPIDKIHIVNPRARGKAKFKEIVANISKVGLKRPITVSVRGGGDESYDLVAGQGRLEAYQALGQTEVPALVIDVPREDRYIMSLVENIARRSTRRWSSCGDRRDEGARRRRRRDRREGRYDREVRAGPAAPPQERRGAADPRRREGPDPDCGRRPDRAVRRRQRAAGSCRSVRERPAARPGPAQGPRAHRRTPPAR